MKTLQFTCLPHVWPQVVSGVATACWCNVVLWSRGVSGALSQPPNLVTKLSSQVRLQSVAPRFLNKITFVCKQPLTNQ